MAQVNKKSVGDALLWAAGGILLVLVVSTLLSFENLALWAALAALVGASIPFFARE